MSNVSFGVDSFPPQSTATPSAGGVVGFGPNITWGDGADGDVTISAGTTTLSREMYYNSLTILNGGILKPNGMRIFVKTFTQVDAGGSLNDNGNNASGSSIGGALSAIGWMQLAAGGGGVGRSTAGAGTSASAVANTITTNGTAFVRGGAGASASATNVGGAGGTASNGTSLPGARLFTAFQTFRAYSGASWNGATGGGGGGATIVSPDTGTSGGGGGAGRGVWLASNTIICNGTISANGGAGANAVGTGAAIVGGGGGGGGGIVCVQTTTAAASLTNVTASGGLAGTSVGAVTAASVAGNDGHKLIVVYAS